MINWYKFLLCAVGAGLLWGEIAAGAEVAGDAAKQSSEATPALESGRAAKLDLSSENTFQQSYGALVSDIPAAEQPNFATGFIKLWTNELMKASEKFGSDRAKIWLQLQNKFNNLDYAQLKKMIAAYENEIRLAAAAADKVKLNYQDNATLEASLSEMAKSFPPEARVEFMNQYMQIYYGLVFQSKNEKITPDEVEAQAKKELDGKNYSQLMALYRKLIDNGKGDDNTPAKNVNPPALQLEPRFDTSSEKA
ncbi:MAG: hypothetical protein RR060_02300, partial [Victivallaceae bacterium]